MRLGLDAQLHTTIRRFPAFPTFIYMTLLRTQPASGMHNLAQWLHIANRSPIPHRGFQ